MKLKVYDNYEWPPPEGSGVLVDLEKRSFFFELRWNLGSILFGIALGLFIATTSCRPANSAEITELSCPADTVTFTDDVDLIRKTDAVLAVSDTTEIKKYHYFECSNSRSKEVFLEHMAGVGWELAHIDGDCDRPKGCLIGYHVRVKKIATRKLVDVEVIESPTKTTEWVPDERHPGVYLEWKRIDHPMMEKEIFIPGRAVVWFEWIEE